MFSSVFSAMGARAFPMASLLTQTRVSRFTPWPVWGRATYNERSKNMITPPIKNRPPVIFNVNNTRIYGQSTSSNQHTRRAEDSSIFYPRQYPLAFIRNPCIVASMSLLWFSVNHMVGILKLIRRRICAIHNLVPSAHSNILLRG